MSVRLVIVDDAVQLRTLLKIAFKRDARLEVVADVGDGQQGIDAVGAHLPDVVLMDVSMPVMDGVTATRAIKADFPALPIVIFTGYDDAGVAAEAKLAGADAFLDKTVPLPEVADTLVALAAR